jgi:hypothetical protein
LSEVDDRSQLPETSSLPVGLFGAVVAAAFLYRAVLIQFFPTVYSWDAFTRILDPTRLLVRHWMPIPQIPIFLTEIAGGDIVSLRLTYAAIGTAGAAMVGWYSLKSQGRWAGLATLSLVATLPTFVIYSLVPYQEGCLVLFLFTFLCVWKLDPSEMSRRAHIVAATSLALACLCRYEAWILAGLFALRPIWERRFRELWIFAPSVFAIGWWLAILRTLDTANPLASPPPIDLLKAVATPLHLALTTLVLSAEGLQYVGLLLAIVGAVVAYRRSGLLGREVLLFWVVLFALSAYRAVHSAHVTERMTMLPVVLATIYLPAGLAFLSNRIAAAVDSQRSATAATVIVAALVLAFSFTTREGLEHQARVYAQEREVALHLEELISTEGPNLRIGIVPRPIRNAWGESTLKTIFGQSMKLRFDDPRWVLGLERVKEEEANLDRILLFDSTTSRYRSLSPRASATRSRPVEPFASAEGR